LGHLVSGIYNAGEKCLDFKRKDAGFEILVNALLVGGNSSIALYVPKNNDCFVCGLSKVIQPIITR
jgi:hypothetical protein